MAYKCPIAAALRWSARALNSLPQTANRPNSHYYWPSRQRADPGCSRSIDSTVTAKTGVSPKSVCACARVWCHSLIVWLHCCCRSQQTIWGSKTMGIGPPHWGTEIYSVTPRHFHRGSRNPTLLTTDLINIHWNTNIWLQSPVREPYDAEGKLFCDRNKAINYFKQLQPQSFYSNGLRWSKRLTND